MWLITVSKPTPEYFEQDSSRILKINIRNLLEGPYPFRGILFAILIFKISILLYNQTLKLK